MTPIEPVKAGGGERVMCSVEGCGKAKHARGWCQMHYLRWKRHGDPVGGCAASRVVERSERWRVIAAYWDAGMPTADIARVTGRSRESVRTDMKHMRRAGHALRAYGDPRRFR